MPNFFRRFRLIIILILLTIFAGAFVWYRSSRAAAKTAHTETVKRRDLKQTLTLPGEIAAHETVNLRFQGSGRLAWVGVKEGDTVRKYQALASLDQRDLKNRLNKYLNTYVKTRLDFEQTKEDEQETYATGLTREIRDEAKRIMEKSQYDLNSSVLDVELQALAIEYATLTTPIPGIVTHIDKAFAGENVTPTTAEIEVINPESFYFSVSADQTEVVQVSPGMKADISLDAFDGLKTTGTIRSIAITPKAGETSTVYEIDLELPLTSTGSAAFRIAMTGDATFTVREKPKTLSVATASIKQADGKKYVMKKVGNQAVRMEIKTGDEYDTYTEIISGLSEGDVVYD